MPKVIHDQGEKPLIVHSELRGPIRELSFLRRSLLFAELSMISYNDEREAREAAEAIGFTTVKFFNNDGSQAYQFANDYDCVIASRGTEPNEWNDIQADANAATVLAETAGRVHRGFKKEVDDLWPMLEVVLKKNDRPLWFCGHSLGGAMATICAGRCFLSYIASNPEELYTFGSPRVGDRRYVNYVKLTHYRWVNNNDIVTRVPPTWLGYRHRGNEIYLDYQGRIRKLEGWWRTQDRLHGFLRGLRKFNIDHFSDHLIHMYIEAILRATYEEEGISEPPEPVKLAPPAPHLPESQPSRSTTK
ncbi:Lipase (class 3) [Rosistilla oblonga]|uniref:Lipase (Class 3) n=2 Tax=Rosistilla oblonga TaxID=2527990 RepID=A0A518IWG7_9BACT|nr:Lipase (class 3) [Rosistilla oblonga]